VGTKALKYLLVGALVDVGLVLAPLLLLALLAAAGYDGHCGFGFLFGGSGSPCSRGEYVRMVVTLVAFGVALEWWWLLLPLLLLPPVVGFVVGRRRPAGPPAR
jgi:hypothetical protein